MSEESSERLLVGQQDGAEASFPAGPTEFPLLLRQKQPELDQYQVSQTLKGAGAVQGQVVKNKYRFVQELQLFRYF